MEKQVRLSSYKKMKQKYEQEIISLTSDIIALVDESDFIKSSTVKAKWRFILDSKNLAMAGDRTIIKDADLSEKEKMKAALRFPREIQGFFVEEVDENPFLLIPKINGVKTICFSIISNAHYGPCFLFRTTIEGNGTITWEKHLTKTIHSLTIDHWFYNSGSWFNRQFIGGNTASIWCEEPPSYELMYQEWLSSK